MITRVLVLLACVMTLALPVGVSAQDLLNPACGTTDSQGKKSSICPDPNEPQTTSDNSLFGQDGIITRIIELFSTVIGIAGVIAIMIGGFQYVISTGDSGNINNAKNTILYAIIGLVVAGLAQVIVRFVLYNVK